MYLNDSIIIIIVYFVVYATKSKEKEAEYYEKDCHIAALFNLSYLNGYVKFFTPVD